ncbi:hypothetical protein PWT90_03342 [Aphanocladium album]|nr:hypothetical protein PWT90_03342 [Aphanocladium album]
MGFSPSEARELLDPMPESLERLTVLDCLSDHDEWNWSDSGRFGDFYDDADNEDPTIVAATIIAALRVFDRTRLPNLCSIVVGWKPEANERSEEQIEDLEAIRRDHGVKVDKMLATPALQDLSRPRKKWDALAARGKQGKELDDRVKKG